MMVPSRSASTHLHRFVHAAELPRSRLCWKWEERCVKEGVGNDQALQCNLMSWITERCPPTQKRAKGVQIKAYSNSHLFRFVSGIKITFKSLEKLFCRWYVCKLHRRGFGKKSFQCMQAFSWINSFILLSRWELDGTIDIVIMLVNLAWKRLEATQTCCTVQF